MNPMNSLYSMMYPESNSVRSVRRIRPLACALFPALLSRESGRVDRDRCSRGAVGPPGGQATYEARAVFAR